MVSSVTAADSSLWFERDPERLAFELQRFDAHQLPIERRIGRANGTEEAGNLVVVTQLRFRDEQLPIEVAFPYDFPDSPPSYYAPVVLDRHQGPTGNLCWSGDPDAEWHPSRAAADVLHSRVSNLLRDSEQGPDAVQAGEAPMSEPVTGLVGYTRGCVLVPEDLLKDDLPAGVRDGALSLRGGGNDRFIVERADRLGSTPRVLLDRIGFSTSTHKGRWIALTKSVTPQDFEPDAIVKFLQARANPLMDKAVKDLARLKKLRYVEYWLGLTFIEQGPRRGEQRRNWVFARVRVERNGDPSMNLFRAFALTRDERQRRIPELIGLDHARVLVVGAGSLGAPLTLELAKAGLGRIDLIDNDILDPNNTVRHPGDVRASGLEKAAVVAVAAHNVNPFIAVKPCLIKIGAGAEYDAKLRELVSGADLVIDTTGSFPVARNVQRHCRDTKTTLIVTGLTAGSYGADLAILRPEGPCFECFWGARTEGLIPPPPAAPASEDVTPRGCSHPAFAGAGFDATALAAFAARTTIQTLGVTDYPPAEFDWAVLSFRGDLPAQRTGHLATHESCWFCR